MDVNCNHRDNKIFLQEKAQSRALREHRHMRGSVGVTRMGIIHWRAANCIWCVNTPGRGIFLGTSRGFAPPTASARSGGSGAEGAGRVLAFHPGRLPALVPQRSC